MQAGVDGKGRAQAERVQAHERVAFDAWGLFLRAHASLVTGLDEALRERAGVTLSAYDMLAQVASGPDRCLRMHDLERRVLFSQSTVSRLAARLEREGLLERSVATDDRRALEVRLTAAGTAAFRAARAVAIEYLRARFVRRLRPGEDDALLGILRGLVGGPDA